MRDRQLGRGDHLVVVEQDVDIDRPRDVTLPRSGPFDRLGGTVAPQLPLDAVHLGEHLVRREIGVGHQHLIDERLFGLEAPRGAPVAVRTAQHGSDAGVDQPLRRAQTLLHVADVASRQKYHTCHNLLPIFVESVC